MHTSVYSVRTRVYTCIICMHVFMYFSSIVLSVQPVQTGYRNKCEFSIALCPSTNRPVVGFRLGSYEEGEFTVVSADTCAHVPDGMKQLARVRCYCGIKYAGIFLENFQRGGRMTEKHALDVTNVRGLERALLRMLHSCRTYCGS